jgi:LAO/AO transport system kinase
MPTEARTKETVRDCGWDSVQDQDEKHNGKASIRIGITGPPGSGKSTLVSRLAESFVNAGNRVGVIAVDPSSPFSGGAILGDRVRMNMMHTEADDIFFRSMGSRGAVGGLSAACEGAASVLEACGYNPVLIETVGVGQSEIEIVRHADVVVVVMTPGFGDEIQSIKAGILEIGDVYAVNKSDLPGADRTAHELRAALSAPVLMVSAMCGDGVDELVKSIGLLSSVAKQKKQLKENGLKMKTLKIDHIGVAVKSMEESLDFYENTLGIKSTDIEEVAEQKVKAAFLPCGDSEIERLDSTGPDGAVARFIEKNGEGVQHIAIRVDDIEAALAELKEKGVRLIDETPRYGAGGARIAFVHPKSTGGVLLELCER